MTTDVDPEYEHYCNAEAAEAEQEIMYQEYLSDLIASGNTALFAANVVLDWLHSKEYKDSGLSAIAFIEKNKEYFMQKIKTDNESKTTTT